MKRAVGDLAGVPDERLFKEVSEGIPLIVQNAVGLDETARRLHQEEEFRVSEVIRGFAEEEAAKVLILIDLVRCPRGWEQRAEIAKRFYGHVAKRAYAMTCSYPRIASFKELSELVESELRPYYLDGPNWVDWIFGNSTIEEREQNLYVDYVRELTDDSGDHHWRVPRPAPLAGFEKYKTPDCVTLGQTLSEAGAGSADGLAEIASIWRGFEPAPETDRKQLRGLIGYTLERLAEVGLYSADEVSKGLIVASWPFPMWPLTMKEPQGKQRDLVELREERARTVEWIEETEANRNPPPEISRSKVEAASAAYSAWMIDVDERGLGSGSGSKLVKRFELPSHKRLQEMFREMTEEERAALLALAWFGRESGVGDWPRNYARAKEMVGAPDDGYDIGLGSYWLAGLDRWEAEPRPFKAGQR